MNSFTILEASRATLSGSMPFGEIVGHLINAGVEHYHVDYTRLVTTFYGDDGSVVVTPIPFADLPMIAPDFDATELKAAISDSQQNGQAYEDFTRRAMIAGVQGYMAYLRGKRVTYWGRGGDQHTEWFPGAAS